MKALTKLSCIYQHKYTIDPRCEDGPKCSTIFRSFPKFDPLNQQVGPKTNSSRLHCLCTHLSAFGGNIFVAPNPIDFDRVWKEFGRLPATKNYIVIFTVCSIFGLYFIGVTFARRADKKDRQKVSHSS